MQSLTYPHKAMFQAFTSWTSQTQFPLSPVYLSNPTQKVIDSCFVLITHICLLISIFQPAYIRCGYISLRLSTSALDRRPIFTSFNLTLGSYQGENYASRNWQLVLNILLSRIKYIIIFLKIALPCSTMLNICVYTHI